MSAASEGPGKGAEFIVQLPLVDSARPAAAAPAEPARAAPRRVLVIEDNVDAAESLKEALEVEAHAVDVAYTGPAGIQKARALRPDVVVCDIGLPGLDGYGVAEALRADPDLASVVLVALSGYAAPEDVVKSREAGFDLHLAKPADLNELERVLAQMPRRGSAASASQNGRSLGSPN